MRAGSTAGGKPVKARRHRAKQPERRTRQDAPRPRKSRAAGRGRQIARLTRELDEMAEQQRATSEMLRLIGGSGDLQAVFANILASVVRLCEAHNGVINRWDGDALQLIATHNMPAAFVELRRQSPYRPNQHSASGRMLASKAPIHIVDLAADQAYLKRNPPTVVAVELAGVRTTLAVPMWKENELIGSFSVGRNEVRPFTAKQIQIVQNFSAHAVIAIENARLLKELQETLQQQTAAADVLKIISRSNFDLQAVLDMLVELLARLCGADLAAIHRGEGAKYRTIATYGGPPSHRAVASTVTLAPGRGSVIGRTVLERMPVQVADVLADPDYTLHDPQRELGYRTVLGVPLLREGEPIGVIVLMRSVVQPFADKQIELVQNFSDQAVIAIEYMRLLAELRQRTDELGRSVGELQRERKNKLMNLEAMAAAISHEVRQPLAGIAANGSAALRFLEHAPPDLGEVRSALHRMVSDSHRASEVFDNIRALFGKADQGYEPIDVNDLVGSVMDGVNAELQRHGITAGVELAEDLPTIVGHRGQLQEVLVNLIRNAIEAMQPDEDSRRVLGVSTQRHGGSRIMVAVEDTGPGIDAGRTAKIFDAFVTTKSHGMGLGLALCRMIVERHGGQLSAVAAQPRGSIFRVVLPTGRPAAAQKSQ
jgi:two-component system, NtrC family, sensor kinase